MPAYTFKCPYGHTHDRRMSSDGLADYMVCPTCGQALERKFVAPALRFYLSPDEFMRDYAGKKIKPQDYDTADPKQIREHEGQAPR